MHRTYLLVRPIVAFDQETKKVFEIPAGAIIKLPKSPNDVGIESVLWNGQVVMVSPQDMEENGVNTPVASQSG